MVPSGVGDLLPIDEECVIVSFQDKLCRSAGRTPRAAIWKENNGCLPRSPCDRPQFDADVAEIEEIKLGDRARFTVGAFPERSFEAVVSQLPLAPRMMRNIVTYDVVLEMVDNSKLLGRHDRNGADHHRKADRFLRTSKQAIT